MRLALIVNTRSSAIGSGFGWLWRNQIAVVPSVAAVEISKQFVPFFKQQRQPSVNLSI
jgi:16S rRNA A1518/A1519 N6-dimethyltransferase RsmA/KsgA/DIM1 with predicted DNA glycosylase/AP lyase activity